MNGVLVDSNIILDVITEDPNWFDWSSAVLEHYAGSYPLFINPIIYAEVSIGYKKIEELEAALPTHLFKRSSIPWEAAFLAGQVFQRYRQSGGSRVHPLPDFFIGAHTLVDGLLLLTRDMKRFQHYFPNLSLVTPDNNPLL
jgi:predicted nucleic acid-binding protein